MSFEEFALDLARRGLGHEMIELDSGFGFIQYENENGAKVVAAFSGTKHSIIFIDRGFVRGKVRI